jgi:cytochrome P450
MTSSEDVAVLNPSEYKADPHPLYARLRESAPAVRVVVNGLPAWLVTRFEEVRQALTDPRLSNNPRFRRGGHATWPAPGPDSPLSRHMLMTDPPEHTRLRRLVSKAFTLRRVEALRPQVQQITDGLLAAILPRGQADLIDDFALPLPRTVISQLLGIPEGDRDDLFGWLGLTLSADPTVLAQVPKAFENIGSYLHGLVERRSRERSTDAESDDLVSALVAVRDEGQRLETDEVVSMALLLVIAGHETTVNLIGNGTLTLLRHPDQLAALRADPGRLPGAVEEILRYETPVEVNQPRFAREEVRIGDAVIAPGEAVLLGLGSGNRDGARYPDADRFDIRREPGHLAFGHGVHFCLGAPLARLEGQIAFRELLDRCQDLALAVEESELRWRMNPHIRGPLHLPVTFTAVP